MPSPRAAALLLATLSLSVLVPALALAPAPGVAAQGAGEPAVPEPMRTTLEAYALLIDEALDRARERDFDVATYENASAHVHEFIDQGLVRSAALMTADKLGRETAVLIMRDSQLESEPAAFINAETAQLANEARPVLDEAWKRLAENPSDADGLMARVYAGSFWLQAEGLMASYRNRAQGDPDPLARLHPSTRAAALAPLVANLSHDAASIDGGASADMRAISERVASRIDAFRLVDGVDLSGNLAAAEDAVERQSVPMSLVHYANLVRLRFGYELTQNLTGIGTVALEYAAENGTAALATFDAGKRLDGAGYPEYLADEARGELALALAGAPGVTPETQGHAEDMARALATVEAVEALTAILVQEPARSTPLPWPVLVAPLAMAGWWERRRQATRTGRPGHARGAGSARSPARRLVGVTLAVVMVLGGTGALVGWAGQADAQGTGATLVEPSAGVEVTMPGQHRYFTVVPAPDGTLHVLFQYNIEDRTEVHHGTLDPATGALSETERLSTSKFAYQPRGLFLSDGRALFTWFETNTDDRELAGENARPVAAFWDGDGNGDGHGLGPVSVLNETFGQGGVVNLVETGDGRPVVYMATSGAPILYVHDGETWVEHVAPNEAPLVAAIGYGAIHPLDDDGLLVAWVERGTHDPYGVDQPARFGIVMTFDGERWSDRRVLANVTSGIAMAGDVDDPWIFFVSSRLNPDGDPYVRARRELYTTPSSRAGLDMPINITRSPGVGENAEVWAQNVGDRPLVIFHRGWNNGTILGTWGPPFARGTPLGTWSFPSKWVANLDSVVSTGDSLYVGLSAFNASVEAVKTGNVPTVARLYELSPPPTVDLADPKVHPVEPRPGSAHRSVERARALLSDDVGVVVSSVEVRFDGTDVTSKATITPATLELPLDDPAPGEHTIEVTLSDFAGNTTTASWSFYVDRTPPTATVSVTPEAAGTGDWWTVAPTVTLAVEDDSPAPGTLRYSTNNITFHDYREPLVLDQPGVRRLWYIPFDAAGNRGELRMETFQVDTTPPVVKVDMALFSPGPAGLAWTVEDPESGVATVEWSPIVDGTWTDPTPVDAEGTVEVPVQVPFSRYGVRATNGAGLSAGEVRTVALDTERPTLQVAGLPAGAGDVAITASDALGNVTVAVRVDDGNWSTVAGPPFSYAFDAADHPAGERTFTVRVVDEAGNAAWSNQTFEGTGAEDGAGGSMTTPAPGAVLPLVLAGLAALAGRSRRGQRDPP